MIFKKKQKSYIGVDIGSTSVKIVELQRVKGRTHLINYGYSSEESDFSDSKSNRLEPEKISKIITKICDKAGIVSKNAVAGLPSFAVFSSIINISSNNQKDLRAAVMWEAKKVVPLDLDEMILDWKVIEKNKDKKDPLGEKEDAGSQAEEQIKVLLTGAPKNLINKYIEIFKTARINLLSLETEIFSMIRSLVGNDPLVAAVVDMGAVNTDIVVVEKGMPVFSRSLDMGGIMVTKAVKDSLRVDYKRAEQFKFDISSLGAGASDSQDAVPRAIKSAIEPIMNEVEYSLNLFQEKNNKKIEKLILSGGGSNLAEITGYLEKNLNIKVIIGDPWARVVYPLDLKPVLDEVGAKMSIAIGLALREVD